MNTLEILTKGLELIRDPKRWTQQVLARDSNEVPMSNPFSSQACSWCSLGALMKVCGPNLHDYGPAKAHLRQATDVGSIDNFNDTHTHAEVIQLWEKAIERARNPHPGA